jgi:4'-phosphopantetheinyl transferase
VALAFHPAHAVGVDIEQVRPHEDLDGPARQIFSPEDHPVWARLEPEPRRQAFFQAWTRHEAALKAVGRGLAQAGSAVLDPRLVFFDLDLPSGYCGTVACLR